MKGVEPFYAKEEKKEEEKRRKEVLKSIEELIQLGETREEKKLKEKLEHLKNIYEYLKNRGKEKIEELNLENIVDEDFRAKSDIFKDIYSEEILEQDKKKVKKIDGKIEQREIELFRKIRALKGEIVEISKTIFSDKLFNNKFVVVRTNKYDDYVNGIDEILIDKETGQPIAALDLITYEPDYEKESIEKSIERKKRKFFAKVLFGSFLKYSLYLDKNKKLRLGGFVDVPFLFIKFNFQDILNIIKADIENDDSKIKEIGKNLIDEILKFYEEEIFNLENEETISIKESAINNFLENFETLLPEIERLKEKYKNILKQSILNIDMKDLYLFYIYFEVYNRIKNGEDVIKGFRLARLKFVYDTLKKLFESY